MRQSSPLFALAAGALASSSLVAGHSFHSHDDEHLNVKRAAAGAGCGPSAGGAVCNAGLCCSEGVSVVMLLSVKRMRC